MCGRQYLMLFGNFADNFLVDTYLESEGNIFWVVVGWSGGQCAHLCDAATLGHGVSVSGRLEGVRGRGANDAHHLKFEDLDKN